MRSTASLESARAWAAFAYRAWTGVEPSPPAQQPDAYDLQRLGIAPFLYRAFRTAGDPRASVLAAQYRHTATANVIRMAHGARVRDALETRGVPAVLVKGGAFLLRFCHDSFGLRPMADLDLLVAPDRWDRAAGVLRESGFEPAHPSDRIAARASHAWTFVRGGAPVALEIDLHRGVAQWPMATRLARRILTAHDRIESWRVPRLPDAFCLTAVHRARHGFVWSALDLFELKRAAHAMDDEAWREVVDSASAGCLGAVWATYNQAVWWLGADDRDATRLAQLAARLGSARQRLLLRLAPLEGVMMPDRRWQRPLLRNFIVNACTTTTLHALVAAGMFLPLRAADEWQYARHLGLGSTGRLRWLWKYTLRGAEAAGGAAGRSC